MVPSGSTLQIPLRLPEPSHRDDGVADGWAPEKPVRRETAPCQSRDVSGAAAAVEALGTKTV